MIRLLISILHIVDAHFRQYCSIKHMLCCSSSVGTAEPGHPHRAGTWFQSWLEWGLEWWIVPVLLLNHLCSCSIRLDSNVPFFSCWKNRIHWFLTLNAHLLFSWMDFTVLNDFSVFSAYRTWCQGKCKIFWIIFWASVMV